MSSHIKTLPKHVINVYTEEYRPGDFLVHMAGKLYEATVEGAVAITRQFDVLSRQENPKAVEAFFTTRYLLNAYSGHCRLPKEDYEMKNYCPPTDDRRSKLDQPMLAMSVPDRYQHAGIRRVSLMGWKDKWDVERPSKKK